MKNHCKKLLVVSFISHGLFQTQAQEADNFIADWFYIGGVNHIYPELNDKIQEPNRIKLRLRICDNSNIQVLENDIIMHEAYLNGNDQIVRRYDSGYLRGKISIKNDTLIMRSRQTRLCPVWDYSVYFKKIERSESQ